MTEKIGLIKNPLTIIAIFAGIAEVSGTGVLPFISPENQLTFIYFLISFPSVLVIVFFITLNFNNKALYAPSDFSNEENYIKIFKYDVSKQENVQIKVGQEELLKTLNENILKLHNFNEERFLRIEDVIKLLKGEKQVEKIGIPQIEIEEEDYEEIEDYHFVEISNFRTANSLKLKLLKKGYDAEIYLAPREDENDFSKYSEHKGIWLGKKINLKVAIDIISIAKETYPHLEYIDLSDNLSKGAPSFVHSQIYIGGSTQTCVERGLKPLTDQDFEKIKSISNIKELHSFVRGFR